MHLPVGIGGPSEDKAAGDELRDDSGAQALCSSEQSGLAGSFSILAHYFATSSASFRANLTRGGWGAEGAGRGGSFEVEVDNGRDADPAQVDPEKPGLRSGVCESFRVTGGTLNCEWPCA